MCFRIENYVQSISRMDVLRANRVIVAEDWHAVGNVHNAPVYHSKLNMTITQLRFKKLTFEDTRSRRIVSEIRRRWRRY